MKTKRQNGKRTTSDTTALHLRFNAIEKELDGLRYDTEDGCDIHAAAICELEIELESVKDRIEGENNCK